MLIYQPMQCVCVFTMIDLTGYSPHLIDSSDCFSLSLSFSAFFFFSPLPPLSPSLSLFLCALVSHLLFRPPPSLSPRECEASALLNDHVHSGASGELKTHYKRVTWVSGGTSEIGGTRKRDEET